jgi:hypothetical protein
MSALTTCRVVLVLFVIGLVVSGLTAFPLLHEIEWLCHRLDVDRSATALAHWLREVRAGLRWQFDRFPFLAYGTDWLGFGHLVIALFFLPAIANPVKFRANLWMGLVACAGVFVVAILAGTWRGIPVGWRLIDCAFGVGGGLLLVWALFLSYRIQRRGMSNRS